MTRTEVNEKLQRVRNIAPDTPISIGTRILLNAIDAVLDYIDERVT